MTKIVEIAVSLMVSLIILLGAFFYVIDLNGFYTYEIEKNDIAGIVNIPKDDLLPLYKALTDYMVDKRDDIQIQAMVDGVAIPMYNQREIDHMVDVKRLSMAAKHLLYILMGLTALGLFHLVRRKIDFKHIFLGQLISTLIIFVGFAGMAMTDFTTYFIKFHELVFTNDLWVLDPNTSRMIQLLPEVFFRDVVILTVLGYGFVSFLLAIAGVAVNRRLLKR
ncbi:MAG: TIGR01906 family membrane protein [Clostridia bacterium]|nr:TIGR01906 family membrane protein [Clostridia bacterium]